CAHSPFYLLYIFWLPSPPPSSLFPYTTLFRSDKGVQYVAIRYTERLAEAEAVASVGSKGDSYDNALAEAFNSLFKAELVRNLGPWKGLDDVEIATAEYIDWFNHTRPHGEIQQYTPVAYEQAHTSPQNPAELVGTR